MQTLGALELGHILAMGAVCLSLMVERYFSDPLIIMINSIADLIFSYRTIALMFDFLIAKN